MLNRLTFKVGLYNMFQWHFRGSRPMTRQFHDNWLRIDLEIKQNHSPRRDGCYISIILNINPPSATQLSNAGLMLNHPIRSWPIISCKVFSSPLANMSYMPKYWIYITQKGRCQYICRLWKGFAIVCEEELPSDSWLMVPLITVFAMDSTCKIKLNS